MERLSFVLSLLLIVSVTTTFGSVIKAKNPTEEELEELPSDPNSGAKPEVNIDMAKGHKSGDVISGHYLTAQTLKDFLNSLPGSAKYKVAIGIDNESGFTWVDPTTYFYSGTAEGKLPYYLNDEKAVLYGALSTEEGPSKPSAIGVLAYYIPDMEKTLAVLWGDPNRSETPSTNYWNIRLYDGEKPANFEMFSDLHNHDPIVSYETQHKDLGSGLKVIGSISKTDLTTLGIHVRKVE